MAPIIVASDWPSRFEVMCDNSGFALEGVLGKHKEKLFYPIYYISKTLNYAQSNCTITEQELLAVEYAFEKFLAYFLGIKVVVYTDHSAFKYLMENNKSKPCIIRWIFLFQEFDFEVKDRKGCENQVTDHLSHLEGN